MRYAASFLPVLQPLLLQHHHPDAIVLIRFNHLVILWICFSVEAEGFQVGTFPANLGLEMVKL